jgi:DNA ligase-1
VQEASGTLAQFASTAERIRAARGKSEKVRLLAAFLSSLPESDLYRAVLFSTGAVVPRGAGKTLQVGYAAIAAAAGAAAGGAADLTAAYQRWGDLGDAVADVLPRRDVPSGLGLAKTAAALEALADLPASERPTALEAILGRLSTAEARYLVKVLTGELRIGLQEGLVEEALAAAFSVPVALVRQAHQRRADLGEVALAVRAGRADTFGVELFQPVKPMLASPEATPAGLAQRLGPELWVEDKLDGIRVQAHVDGRVVLFSRDLKDVSDAFPEVTAALEGLTGPLILDGELLAWRDGRALPFLALQKRLGRKRVTPAVLAGTPIVFCAFDLLFEGEPLLHLPLHDRRARLAALPLPAGVLLSELRVVGEGAIDAEFAAARERGNEGLMLKDPDSAYTPGRRGLSWLKYKKALEPLDVVVTGVEYGHGKRHGVLSDYTFAVWDEASGELVNIGKAYTGLTDAEITQLTAYFKANAVAEYGRFLAVRPELVIEVAFEAIHESPRHKSGFALRFPRIVRLRPDKTAAEADTLAAVRRIRAGRGGPAVMGSE